MKRFEDGEHIIERSEITNGLYVTGSAKVTVKGDVNTTDEHLDGTPMDRIGVSLVAEDDSVVIVENSVTGKIEAIDNSTVYVGKTVRGGVTAKDLAAVVVVESVCDKVVSRDKSKIYVGNNISEGRHHDQSLITVGKLPRRESDNIV